MGTALEGAPEERDENPILYKTVDGIATITLNRPDRLNAFTRRMRELYLRCLARADRDEEVRAIVVTGAGRAFCAGADFKELDGLDAATLRARNAAQEIPFDTAVRLTKPLIAAVNGPVAGIGMAHALMADLRFAGASARFTTSFARLGLTAEGGVAWLLARLVGTARALDLLYSARLIDSAEALRIGLVQWVVPDGELLARARAYAADLAATSSPYSLARMREQVYGAWEQDWPSAYARAEELVYESLDRPEFAELAVRRPVASQNAHPRTRS
ncbi:Enoyl-CoA hydratase/carnithine racemase [Thermomonospora echinospora]|uniref:Enoyl-CoA hydratase/carnithine racemase n=1 Tax=Thermomonospora echinospora TaxID=1992 RepID=A0A1H6DUB4_9ACTN|nr:enoyl-CoA hydratase-related protein [Thermomonospora echinospora]SEG88634.1 Enoyl-CoA hydratase/carnithine racemase [Thermomonospora echinospora]